MPLVVMTGFPSAGKTHRTEELAAYLRRVDCPYGSRHVVIVNEEALGLCRSSAYADANAEKITRAELQSMALRSLDPTIVVILDSLNYIKGFRYQLYCEARGHGATACTVHVATSAKTCRNYNDKRTEDNRYSNEQLNSLIQRFECPDSRNRWDSPLVTIAEDEDTPVLAIAQALFERKQRPPNEAVVPIAITATNFLAELNRMTQEIGSAIIAAQSTVPLGVAIPVPHSSTPLRLNRAVTMSQLNRARRHFIATQKVKQASVDAIGAMYVAYLNDGDLNK